MGMGNGPTFWLAFFAFFAFLGAFGDFAIIYLFAPFTGHAYIDKALEYMRNDPPLLVFLIYLNQVFTWMAMISAIGLFFLQNWAYRIFMFFVVYDLVFEVLIAVYLKYVQDVNPPFFPFLGALITFFFFRANWITGQFLEEELEDLGTEHEKGTAG